MGCHSTVDFPPPPHPVHFLRLPCWYFFILQGGKRRCERKASTWTYVGVTYDGIGGSRKTLSRFKFQKLDMLRRMNKLAHAMRLNFTHHELKTPSNIYAPLFDGQSFPLLVTELLSALMKPLHFCVLSFSNYAWLMLAAVRALVEQQPAEEDYSKFRWNMILFHSALTRLSVSGNERKEKGALRFPENWGFSPALALSLVCPDWEPETGFITYSLVLL